MILKATPTMSHPCRPAFRSGVPCFAAGDTKTENRGASVLNPGPIDTGWMTDEIRASGIAQQPTGHLGTPDDTANVVRFLLSMQGDRINDNPCTANGGYPKGGSPSNQRHPARSGIALLRNGSRLRSTRHNESADLGVKGYRSARVDV